ncbi:MAG: type II toxin-antitoxin system RelE/ParE family toxin [Nitrospinae bacterium]|nr:type II toxin-antitoxin system RelE/ParE family toxin [Nitrospinota bacterium]
MVSFHEDAEDELNDAADFYNLESPGLGMSFLDDIYTIIEDITMFPEAGPLLKGRVRRRVLRKFPYTVIYSLRETEIRILAVAHQKRRPFYWHERR